MIQVANISILYPRATSKEKLTALFQKPIKLLEELLKSYEKMSHFTKCYISYISQKRKKNVPTIKV